MMDPICKCEHCTCVHIPMDMWDVCLMCFVRDCKGWYTCACTCFCLEQFTLEGMICEFCKYENACVEEKDWYGSAN